MEIDSPEFQNYLDQIHEVPLEDVCDDLGIETRYKSGALQLICPFHNDTNFGSCIAKNNRIFCFACGESADNVKIVQKVLGVNFFEACEHIADLGNIPKPAASSKTKIRPRSEMPVTDEQLIYLGLLPVKYESLKQIGMENAGRFLDVTGFAESSVDFDKEKEQHEFTVDGYLIGNTVKQSLSDLFNEDPMGFHSLIIGKLFYTLVERIADYMVKDHPYKETKEEEERVIEQVLWPLAKYYQPVADTYVSSVDDDGTVHHYDFSFLNQYKRRVSAHKIIL